MPDLDSALLAFALGPVQDYISAARRTQDLYVGSALLAQLMAVAHETARAAGGTVRFPVWPGDTPPASLPNRLLVEFADQDAARTAAQAITVAVQDRWGHVADAVHQWLNDQIIRTPALTTADWSRTWDTQVDHYLETVWAVLAGDASPRYSVRLAEVQARLQARKRLHDFPADLEYGYKCTIFNGMTAMGPGHGDPDPAAAQSYGELRAFWGALADRIRTRPTAIALRPAGRERLSALACVKRFAGQEDLRLDSTVGSLKQNVPSTSGIATATYKAALLARLGTGDVELAQRLHAYGAALAAITDGETGIHQLSSSMAADVTPYLYILARVAADQRAANMVLRYDGDLFYTETLTANRLYDDYGLRVSDGRAGALGGRDIREPLKKAHIALDAVLTYTNTLKIDPPARYYAILQMDGDHLGQLLKSIEQPEQHTKLSRELGVFATTQVPKIIEIDHPGKLIYAGGDDVLALLPLADALPAAAALQAAYHQYISAVVPETVRDQVTASIGIAIAHQQAALDQVLAAARTAEQSAKREYGRNAIAVIALKRSGAPIYVGAHHAAADQPTSLAPIDAVMLLMQQGLLSPRFAGFWAQEAPAFADTAPIKMLQAEIGRLLLRQTRDAAKEMLTLWQDSRQPWAGRLCTALDLDYAQINLLLAAEPNRASHAILLQHQVCKKLARRLAELAFSLQDNQLQAVSTPRTLSPAAWDRPPQAEESARVQMPPAKLGEPKWDRPPQAEEAASGAVRLADWLGIAAFLTRGGAE